MRYERTETDDRRETKRSLVRAVGLVTIAALIAALPAAAARKKAETPKGPAVHISQVDYHGWHNCFQMTAGKVRVVVVPDIGGRVMEYSLDGDNPFFESKAEAGKVYPITKTWHNYGGFKNWNAPQDLWGWPPDPYLDFGRASVEVVDPDSASPTLRITGAPSIGAGLMFVRELSLDAATGDLHVNQRIVNIAAKNQVWSAWDITQVSTPCIVALPANPKSSFPGGIHLLSDGQHSEASQWHTTGGLIIVNPDHKVGKFGIDSSAGWMAYFHDRLAYVKQFPPLQSGAAYPDKGCSAEVYVSDTLPYLEMEVLSPLFEMPPAAYGELSEVWQIRRLAHPVRTDADVARAAAELGLTVVHPPVT